jgi:hypothetical protein
MAKRSRTLSYEQKIKEGRGSGSLMKLKIN